MAASVSKSRRRGRYCNSSSEIIWLAVIMCVRIPLSLRSVKDLFFGRAINICHETVRLWRNRFGPMSAADIQRQGLNSMGCFRHWR